MNAYEVKDMLYKNGKHTLWVVKVFVYETFTDEGVKYLLCKHFLCYLSLSDSKALFLSGFRKRSRT